MFAGVGCRQPETRFRVSKLAFFPAVPTQNPYLSHNYSVLSGPPDHGKLVRVDDITVGEIVVVMRLRWRGWMKPVGHVVTGITEDAARRREPVV